MDERATDVPPAQFVILAVGCDDAEQAALRTSAQRFDVSLETVDLAGLVLAAATLRPLLIVITAEVHAFDPIELDALAGAVGAGRVVIDPSASRFATQQRVRQAIEAALTARAHTTDALRPPPRRASYGIRWRR